MNARRSCKVGVAVLLVLTAAACGDDDDDAAEGTGADTGTVATAGPATTDAAAAATTEAEAAATSIATETSGAATSAAAAPSGEPVVIGVLTSLTGPFTPWGVQVRDGMQLAVDELNAAGGIAGRPVELSVVDDESNPEAGASGIERLAEEGVVAIGGIISSDVGLATSRVAEELQVPLFLVKAGSEAILTQQSRHTFRTCLPAAPMVAGPIAQYAQQEGSDQGRGHHRRLRVGAGDPQRAGDGVRRARGRRVADRGGARARAGLHDVPAQPRGVRP